MANDDLKKSFERIDKIDFQEEREKLQQEQRASDKRKSLNKFVLDTTELPQILNHAVGKIKIANNYFRYYGARINEKIVHRAKGGMVEKIVLSPAIVLETGIIITENNKPDDVNFVFDSIMTLKNNRWSLESINHFCQENIVIEKFSFESVFNEMRKFYEKNMVFDDDCWNDILALRDLKSYFWDLNDKFLIIKHEGISGTAKSKGMKIGANLSFNGKKFLCPTPANFFRYRHHNKATLFIEEAERLFDNSKKKNNADSELVEYLNGSYEKGNTVPRQNDKDINQTDEFDPAGDSGIGSIAPLKGALEKRSVALHMIKAPKNDNRGNLEIPTEKDTGYSRVRNMAYICGLLNYRDYEKSLNDVKNSYNLANRQWSLAKPFISLAKCIKPELEQKVGKFLSKLFEVRDDSFDNESWEFLMAKTLVKIFCLHEDETFFSVEDVKTAFLSELESIGKSYYNISNTKVGMLVSELGLSKFKKNPTGNQRGYKAGFFGVIEILIRQEILRIENIQKWVSEVSEVSDCKFLRENIEEWYTDTLLTPDTIIKKDDDKSDTTDRTDTCLEGGGDVFGALQVISKEKKLISLEEIKSLPFEDIEKSLTKLKEQGLIFEPKTEVYQLL